MKIGQDTDRVLGHRATSRQMWVGCLSVWMWSCTYIYPPVFLGNSSYVSYNPVSRYALNRRASMCEHMRTFARAGALSPKGDRIVARSPEKGILRELLSPLSVPRKHTWSRGSAHPQRPLFLETRDTRRGHLATALPLTADF